MLHLRPGVYAADIHGDIILMDTPVDSYVAISRSQASAFHEALLSGEGALAADLKALNLLMSDRPEANDHVASLWKAERDLADRTSKQATSAFDLCRLSGAALMTLWRIRFQPPKNWFLQRQRRSPRHEMAEDIVAAAASKLPSLLVFLPFVERCLPRCLVALSLLDTQGIKATWVFGVRTHPFEAHCWLQWRDIVLNDRLDHIQRFTPIFHV